MSACGWLCGYTPDVRKLACRWRKLQNVDDVLVVRACGWPCGARSVPAGSSPPETGCVVRDRGPKVCELRLLVLACGWPCGARSVPLGSSLPVGASLVPIAPVAPVLQVLLALLLMFFACCSARTSRARTIATLAKLVYEVALRAHTQTERRVERKPVLLNAYVC